MALHFEIHFAGPVTTQMYDVNILYHSEIAGGRLSFKQAQKKIKKLCFSGSKLMLKRLVSDLVSETKGSQFESGQLLGVREEGGSGRNELELASPFPCCPVIRMFSERRKLPIGSHSQVF